MIEFVVTDKQVGTSTCQKVRLLVVVVDNFRLRDNLLATVETVRRYTVPQVGFTGCRVNRQRGFFQFVVPAARTTRCRGPATLLNSHISLQSQWRQGAIT